MALQDRLLPDLAPCAMMVDMTNVEEYRLTPDQAKFLNDQIKTTIQELEDLLSEFISGEGWLALGYDTAWAWWSKEVGEKRLTSSTRKLVALQFNKEDVSNKKISKALGSSNDTIARDLGRIDGVSNETPEHETTPIEPTEILPAVETWNGQTSEELAAEFKDLLETNRSVLEPSIPYDFTPDNAMSMALESASGWMEMAERVSKKEISSKMKARIRIELEIMRDMIDMIEERL